MNQGLDHVQVNWELVYHLYAEYIFDSIDGAVPVSSLGVMHLKQINFNRLLAVIIETRHKKDKPCPN